MPPITSRRAGTRVIHTSPLLKKLASPVRSLDGFFSRCSNSRTSTGSASEDIDSKYRTREARHRRPESSCQQTLRVKDGSMSSLTIDDRGVIVSCGSCGRLNRLPYDRLGQNVRCGQCHTDLAAPAAPVPADSSAHFDRLVGASSL